MDRKHPCDWHPGTVTNLRTGSQHCDADAFEAIAAALEDPSVVVTAVILRAPPGKTAYELLIPQGGAHAPIYAKVQLGAGVVLARSFHYSDYAVRTHE